MFNKRINNFIDKYGSLVIKIFFALFIILFVSTNIIFTTRMYDYKNYYEFGLKINNIIYLIIITLIIYYLVKKNFFNLSANKMMIILISICLIFGTYWILSNYPELVDYSDDYNCLRTARSIMNGDYGVLGFRTYINTYPHNLTLVTYFLFHLKIFGEFATTSIRFTNLIFVCIGYYAIFKITNELFKNELINKIVIVLELLSLQFLFYTFLVYGNVLSYTLALVSIYYLLRYLNYHRKLDLLIVGISIVFAVCIKSNSLIIMIAEIIYLVIDLIKNKKYLNTFAIILILIMQLVMTKGIVNFWADKVNYNYDNKLPTICWFGYGFNYDQRHPGGYMNEFEAYHFENGYHEEWTKEYVKTFIEGTLNEWAKRPLVVPRFYMQKFMVSFANPEYDAFSMFSNLPLSKFNENVIKGEIHEILINIWDSASSIIAIGLLIYAYKNYHKNNLNELLCIVVIIGGFLFHSFWEVKAIYTYQYYMYLLPYAAYGIKNLIIKE